MNEAENLNDKISVYPNPSSDIINVETSLNVDAAALYDISGKMVWNGFYERTGGFQLDVSNLQHGIYFLNIQTHKGIARKKIAIN